ncbi:hypothetical protein [Bradyrhizobium sp. STM 3557]|uniref:hypothetical protein n=1 Tax=Bradyrhizobium sp. STM 3557 TaxID=578920 RepID=UPI00388FD125
MPYVYSLFLRMIAIAIAINGIHIAAHAEEGPDSSRTDKSDQGTETTAPVIDKIDVRPGDRWTYQVIDDITGETKSTVVHTVTELKDKTYSVQSTFTPYGQSVGTSALQVFDENWNLLEDQVWTQNPANPSTGIQLPLKLGAQWKVHLTSNRKTPPEVHFNVDATEKVVAYEPVILKFNKTYDAFKLEVDETLTNSATPTSVVTTKTTMWFAPSVNRYVKRILESRVNDRLQSRGIELLTAYARRHDDN